MVTEAESSPGPDFRTGAAPPPPKTRLQLRRSFAAARLLFTDAENETAQAFDLVQALGGERLEPTFREFLKYPEGHRLLVEKPDLVPTIADAALLRSMPAGSLGRAFAAFAAANGLEGDGVVTMSRATAETREAGLDPDRKWFYARLDATHDLWHVVTGYGTDGAGEAALQAFSRGQGLKSRAAALMLYGGAFLGFFAKGGGDFERFLLEAYNRGRRASRLFVQRFEDLLPRDLDLVRRELGLGSVAEDHPDGVMVLEDGPRFVRVPSARGF